LSGFGLVLVNDSSPCFSWEWFRKERGDVFSKLQGSGKVKASIAESPETRELVAVECPDDITLRCVDLSNGNIHAALIKKGSVLRLRP
jgi:hypothetical protein